MVGDVLSGGDGDRSVCEGGRWKRTASEREEGKEDTAATR